MREEKNVWKWPFKFFFLCLLPDLSREYGDEWHKAGILENKQNVFDDFIAAAEYLFENKYTNPRRSAANIATAIISLIREAWDRRVPVDIEMYRKHNYSFMSGHAYNHTQF